MEHKVSVLVLLLCAWAASAQDIQINRQNKTIAVTADESVTADAEVAVLAIGSTIMHPARMRHFTRTCGLPS